MPRKTWEYLKKAMNNWLKKNVRLLVATVLILAFIVAEGYALWYKGDASVAMVPLALLVLWLFVTRLETGFLLIALLTPFAVNMALLPGMELSMPVEPMMILFTFIFFFRVLVSRQQDGKFPTSPSLELSKSQSLLRHPVTLLILASLAWMVITSSTSELPWVSFKYTLARVWFVVPFFFAAAQIFKNQRRIRQFFWAYAIGLGVIILMATSKTLGNFSDLQTLHRVMQPYYNDHTAYGCAIALMLPAAVYFVLEGVKKNHLSSHSLSLHFTPFHSIFGLLLLALLLIGLFFSYCRAAWISIAGVIGVYVLIRLGLKVKWMVLLFGLGVGAFFVYQNDLIYKLGKNHQDSSYTLADQVKSISNISTDASNLERLNRWASAFRMWEERPVLGCGPGTYQFLYAGYQRSYQLSTISTNAGDLGNAHSEYIGPLTEQGVPGVALVALLFLTTFATGVRVYRTAKDPQVARMALAFTLSLLTYYIHGVFNNFLDTDKLSVPFWGFTAVVVALDVYGEKKNDSKIKTFIL